MSSPWLLLLPARRPQAASTLRGTLRESARARACGRTPHQDGRALPTTDRVPCKPGEEVGTLPKNPPSGSLPTTEEEGSARPTFVRHRGCHARRLVRSSHTRVRGLADNKPTQVASRSESNAPWAPEANEFERKSFRPQTALGLELKKKKKNTILQACGVLMSPS